MLDSGAVKTIHNPWKLNVNFNAAVSKQFVTSK